MILPLAILLVATHVRPEDGSSPSTLPDESTGNFSPLRIANTSNANESAPTDHLTVTASPTKCIENTESVNGISWTVCQNGRMLDIGCVAEDGHKIPFGESYLTDTIEWTCYEEANNIALVPTALVFNGTYMKVGDRKQLGQFYFECVTQPQGIAIAIVGCTDAYGSMVPLNATFVSGNFVYLCHVEDGGPAKITGLRCLDYNGTAREIGETWAQERLTYQCQKEDQTIRRKAIACADAAGKRISKNKNVIIKAVYYQCMDDEHKGFGLYPIGCYATYDSRTGDRTKYFAFGTRWHSKHGDEFHIVKQCQPSVEQGAKQQPVACVYHAPSGDVTTEIGTATQIGDKAFICQLNKDDSVDAILLDIPEDTEVSQFAKQFGLSTNISSISPESEGQETMSTKAMHLYE